MAIILEAYAKTWHMCLALFGFFVVVALLVWFLSAVRFERPISARVAFWGCLVLGFVMASVCLTLIDKPYINASDEMKDWLFMFSAFLGVPVFIPFFGGAAYAYAHYQHRLALGAFSFGLILLGLFALGCAASNIHDVVWCGTITDCYTQHHKAGYDLDLFVAFGQWFGISGEVLADYATLGPCAVVLVAGELLVAGACFGRLHRLHNAVG